MSKYDKLWRAIADTNKQKIVLSFDEIKKIAEVELDHSFLTAKKELAQYGYSVDAISLKTETVTFVKIT